MASRRFVKKRNIFLSIFIFALLSVGIAFFVLRSLGFRYMFPDESSDLYYIGWSDKFGNIIEGKGWYTDGKSFTVERLTYAVYLPPALAEDSIITSYISNQPENAPGDIFINESTIGLFNEGVLYPENLEELSLSLTEQGIRITGGSFTEHSGQVWNLKARIANPSVFADFDIVRFGAENTSYNGDIHEFLKETSVASGELTTETAGTIRISGVNEGLHRIVYNVNGYKGDVYIGHIDRQTLNREGTGTFFYTRDMYVYTGEFKNNEKSGECKILTAYGDYYTGGFSGNKMNGKGTYVWADGTVYTGDMADNFMTGYGVCTLPDGEVYEGEFLNDAKHGIGTYKWTNGDVYTGEWVNDKYAGQGVFIFGETGARYEGEFKNGLMDGYGTYYWADTARSYTGWFKAGRLALEPPE